ncbi:MAG: nitrite reductase small subunit NirD [Pseudomonadota bacterium]|nr:nitrite reductase small subunit NirD [Pseudomonadota bacterium]
MIEAPLAPAPAVAPVARWTYVCRVNEIVANTGVCAKVGSDQVAVFRVCTDEPGSVDQVYALSNHDPKSGANVLSRGLVGDLLNEPVVASPVYKQHYSLRDGRCLEDESLTIPSFPVLVHDGMILVKERS